MSILTLDQSIIPMLILMEQRGIKIDRDYFDALTWHFECECKRLNSEIDTIAGTHINPKSPKQVLELLHDKGIECRDTNAETLDKFNGSEPLVKLITDYRHYRDMIDKFCMGLPKYADEYDRIHTDILPTRVVSGRLATKNPNLLGIPTRTEVGRKIRQGFIPEQNHSFISIDYSQIEVRVAAHLSQDKELLKAFTNGGDIHSQTCQAMFGEITKELRYAAKRTTFGVLYGITARRLYNTFLQEGITDYTEEDCQAFIDSWFRYYSGVKAYLDRTEARIRREGEVRDMFGRRRLVPEIYSVHPRVVAAGIRQGINHTIQGTAAGIMKKAMALITPICQEIDGIHPLLQIHDELMFEIRNDRTHIVPIIRDIMENTVKLIISIECDIEIGNDWANMKEIEL